MEPVSINMSVISSLQWRHTDAMASQITDNFLFNNMFWLAKEKTAKLCITGFLYRETTSNTYIPRIKDQSCWKFSTIWTSFIHVHVLFATCVRPSLHPPWRPLELRRQYSPSPDGKRFTNIGYHGNSFSITGHLCRESIVYRYDSPHREPSDVELDVFFFEQTVKLLIIWNVLTPV